MADLRRYYALGQSLWLNYLRRAFIESGELSDALREGIRGITSSPLIFEKAITGSADYDQRLQELVAEGMPVKRIYEALVVDDIQRAADVLHTVFEASEGLDGYVTMELDPALAHDAVGTVAEARHLLAAVNRPNVMFEVPATAAGIEAIESLIHDGINVNATHIFSLDVYRQVAEAYYRGITVYLDSHSVWRQTPASVASISISRIDGAVDPLLADIGRADLTGQTGIGVAKGIYQQFRDIFSGPDWENLARRGARVQRPKWTRLTPRNFSYPVTYYASALVAPDTISTLSPATFNALRQNGQVKVTLGSNQEETNFQLAELARIGIDLESIGGQLQEDSLSAFGAYFQSLITSVMKKRDDLDYGWQRVDSRLGAYGADIEQSLTRVCDEQIMSRIWAHDPTVWKPGLEASQQLGWLHIAETMQENAAGLQRLAQSVNESDGQGGLYSEAVLLGTGAHSLTADVFVNDFGPWVQIGQPGRSRLSLSVLDAADPEAVREYSDQLDPARTLFIVSDKTGNTAETLEVFKNYYRLASDRVGAGRAGTYFMAVTDPGTYLARTARQYGFRDLFLDDPKLSSPYSALSYVGLLPAALMGVDLKKLLDRALDMACNSASCNRPVQGDNVGALLGTTLGRLALAGRNRLTLIASPIISTLAEWVELLLAESVEWGLKAVVDQPPGEPGVYGDDRFFVYLRLEKDAAHDGAVAELEDAGYPVLRLHLKDIYDLGGLFFIWEMAAAVAAHHLTVEAPGFSRVAVM